MRLLRLEIHEPLPGHVLPAIAAEHGDAEAARRYKALAVTTMRQLRGLTNTRIEIRCVPDDAAEAIRFWLLPRLANQWQHREGAFISDGWEISFESTAKQHSLTATGHILCPWLSARWVNTAMIGLEAGTHRAIGRTPTGEVYLHAGVTAATGSLEERPLPILTIVHTDGDWQEALDSPLGPALKKAWEAED